jgi:putative PIN family toxin of toxin-antitoxin system
LVLDTNVLLDWLVFRNPAAQAIESAIRSCRVAWWSTAALHAEFEHVVQRGFDRRWAIDPARLATTWADWAQEPPAHQRFDATALRCRDPDDQKFLDFAVQSGADWLLTRDRDLLVLGRRVAAAHGVQIITPEAWILQQGGGMNANAADVGAHSYPQDGA